VREGVQGRSRLTWFTTRSASEEVRLDAFFLAGASGYVSRSPS